MDLLFILVGLVMAVPMIWWHHARSRELLNQWARRNRLSLVNAQRRLLFRGPYTLWSGKGQAVFRVTVRDGTGRTRSGYVRVGGWFLGLLSDQIDAWWDGPYGEEPSR